MVRCVASGLIGICFFLAALMPAQAQGTGDADANARAARQAREAYRERINENALFLMGGQLGAAYNQLANDISVVVNDGTNLRVLPVVGAAGVQNVHDIVFLRGIDLALTSVATLNSLKKSRELGPNLDRQLAYISPLFPEELQVLARGSIQSLEGLRNKKVSFNNQGSATALFAPLVFAALGIDVQPVFLNQPDAIQKMRVDEVQATVCFCPKPVPAYAAVRAEDGFKMLEVPYAKVLEEEYLPGVITKEDYPAIVRDREKVETVAGSTVLITFNWPRGSSRYNRTAKFVDAYFSKFAELQKPPRHPLWRSVNIAASIPGWQRFPAAEEWLSRTKAHEATAVEQAFAEFIKKKTSEGAIVDAQDPDERERLFREFLEGWQKRK